MTRIGCRLLENRTGSGETHRKKAILMDIDHDKFTTAGMSSCTMF